ncbi:MAG: hypothetical protein ABL958_10975 [Bdellovibrionia bacterium]
MKKFSFVFIVALSFASFAEEPMEEKPLEKVKLMGRLTKEPTVDN